LQFATPTWQLGQPGSESVDKRSSIYGARLAME
jgi:hypothetical protein